MSTLISTDLPLCIGCYKCVRACPVETANVTYLDGRDRLKVRVDQTRCVGCGACLDVCPRGARHYQDDTEIMFRRLEAGDAISALVSPAIGGNTADTRGSSTASRPWACGTSTTCPWGWSSTSGPT